MNRLLCCVSLLLLTAPRASANFIVNGNFEQGNTGFLTDYVLPPPGAGVGGAGQYDIVFNPANHHPSGANYGDHTTGSGLMMMVNESRTANLLVWGQTVSVAPNADYAFSAFISSWVSVAPSRLDVLFNGTSLGTMTAPSVTGVWTEFSTTWNSGSATSVTIELRNLTTADVGGDFALDDLSLTGAPAQVVPGPSGFVLALTGAGLLGCGWLRRRRADP